MKDLMVLFIFSIVDRKILLFYNNIYVNSKNKGADLMKTVQLFYFHFIPTV